MRSKYIFSLFIFSLGISIYLYSVSEYSDISNKILYYFNNNLKGLNLSRLNRLSKKQKSSDLDGYFYELESAILLHTYLGENIYGVGLDINIMNEDGSSPVRIVLNEESFYPLTSVEYDIVTTNFVVECKSGAVHIGRSLHQLKKEKFLIDWFTILKEEINLGLAFYDKVLTKKNKHFFVIRAPSTLNKNVYLISKWIEYDEFFEENWKQLIEFISTKKLLTLYDKELGSESIFQFIDNQFLIIDSFNFKFFS